MQLSSIIFVGVVFLLDLSSPFICDAFVVSRTRLPRFSHLWYAETVFLESDLNVQLKMTRTIDEVAIMLILATKGFFVPIDYKKT